jgi:hypothetical protein
MLKTRRFLFGVLVGVALTYGYIHYETLWADTAERWFGKTAAGYRGDRTRHLADDVLK